jgi:hypothetical protein
LSTENGNSLSSNNNQAHHAAKGLKTNPYNPCTGKEHTMKLWVTPNGDKWLCEECQPEFEEQIAREEWRAAFDVLDQTLRCSHCKHADVDFPG